MNPEPDVGGDEAAPRDERDDKAGRDHPLGPAAVHDRLGVIRRETVYVFLELFLVGDQGQGPGLLGCRGGPEQARRGRRSADHPVRRNRALGAFGALGLIHVAHDYFRSVPVGPVGRGSRRLAVIHIEMSTRKPSPPRKITMPSVTGPVRPREKPPGLGSTLVCVMKAMMSRLACGGSAPSENTGMASGPVSIAV